MRAWVSGVSVVCGVWVGKERWMGVRGGWEGGGLLGRLAQKPSPISSFPEIKKHVPISTSKPD